MDRTRIVRDSDPGQDDAAAILLALASPGIAPLGLACVARTAPLARSARSVLALARRPGIPVRAGCDRPFARPRVTGQRARRKAVRDGADLPEPMTPVQAADAVEFPIDTQQGEPPGTVALCPMGPRTLRPTARPPRHRPAARPAPVRGP